MNNEEKIHVLKGACAESGANWRNKIECLPAGTFPKEQTTVIETNKFSLEGELCNDLAINLLADAQAKASAHQAIEILEINVIPFQHEIETGFQDQVYCSMRIIQGIHEKRIAQAVGRRGGDGQEGGQHYAAKVDPWALQMEMKPSGSAFVDARRADAIKYARRMKGGQEKLLEDLKKARHCLNAAIAELESILKSAYSPTP